MNIYNLTGEQLVVLAMAVAAESVQGLTLVQQEVLGYFLTTVGENVLLINAQNQLLEEARISSISTE